MVVDAISAMLFLSADLTTGVTRPAGVACFGDENLGLRFRSLKYGGLGYKINMSRFRVYGLGFCCLGHRKAWIV